MEQRLPDKVPPREAHSVFLPTPRCAKRGRLQGRGGGAVREDGGMVNSHSAIQTMVDQNRFLMGGHQGAALG